MGRDAELARLRRGTKPLVFLLGEPGIGKSRMAEERAKTAGSALLARGVEMSKSTALYSFAIALASAFERAPSRQRLLALAAPWKHELARLLPDLDPDAPATSLPPEARPRFLEGLARALAAAAGARGVIVLDDIHWFDPSSVELALHLAWRATSLDVRIVAAARPLELKESPAASFAAAIEREGLGDVVRLAPLDRAAVGALVDALSKQHPRLAAGAERFEETLFEASGGNPLYVIEVPRTVLAAGDALGDTGAIDAGPSELPMPSGVRDAVIAQVDRLGGAVRRLLEAASVTGGRSPSKTCRAQSGSRRRRRSMRSSGRWSRVSSRAGAAPTRPALARTHTGRSWPSITTSSGAPSPTA